MDLVANYYDNALLLSLLPYFKHGVYCGCQSTFLKLGNCAPSLQVPLYDTQTLLFCPYSNLLLSLPYRKQFQEFPSCFLQIEPIYVAEKRCENKRVCVPCEGLCM